MGSTISVAKNASFIEDAKGERYFLLSEQTYESNMFPQDPRWGAIYFGPVLRCLEKVVEWSAACEGGSIRGPKGSITPTAYIKQWRDAMAAPTQLIQARVQIPFGTSHYEVPLSHRPRVLEILARHSIAAAEDGPVVIDMAAAGALAAAHEITTTKFSRSHFEGLISPWKLFRHLDCYSLPHPEKGLQRPPAVKADLSGVQVFNFPPVEEGGYQPSDATLILRDGRLHTGGMEGFIREVIAPGETARPGSAEPTIRAFRALLKAAQPLPENTAFMVDRGCPLEDETDRPFVGRLIDELAVKLNLVAGIDRIDRIEGTVADLRRAKVGWWDIGSLVYRDALRLELREQPTPAQAAVEAGEGEQLALI